MTAPSREDAKTRLFSELAKALANVSNCNRRQLYRYHRFYSIYPGIVGTLPPQFKQLPLLAEKAIVLPKKEEMQRFIDAQLREVGE